jgi:hypothetical protein
MDGDNNLEKFAIQDFNELETVESNDDINILVQIDRHPGGDEGQGFTRSNGDWNETRRYVIKFDLTADETNFTKYTQGVDMWSLDEQNMADPLTLKEFIEWGVTNYPSEHYLIVMWDHGTGIFSSRGARDDEFGLKESSTRSFCDDATDGGSMNLWELDDVLKETKELTENKKFDIIGFDMCWLGYIETGYEIMESVNFMVASSDEEPDVGWNYGPPVRELQKNPEMSPFEFAITITNKYIEEFQNISSVSYMTQAAVNLTEMGNVLVPKLNLFAEELILHMIDYEGYIVQARSKTDEPLSKPLYADIYHFAELISENSDLPESLRAAASEVMQDYNRVVIAEGHGADHPNAHGLGIYFPRNYASWYSQYTNSLDFAAEKWDEFIEFYLHPVRINHTPLIDTEKVGPHEIITVVRGNDVNEEKIYLWYSTDGKTFKSINLKPTGNANEFSGLIGNQSLGTTVYYYLEAIDTTKYSTTLPSNASKADLGSVFSFYVGLDIIAPNIEHNQSTDFIIEYIEQPYNVSVKITDNIELDLTNLFIYYKTNSSKNYNKIPLTSKVEPDNFFSTIPAQTRGTIIYYYFEATDKAITPNTARLPSTSDFEIKVVSARPQPGFLVNKTIIYTFENVKFTSTSTDDQEIVNWTWGFSDGKVAYGPEVIRQFNNKGVCFVTLTVVDDTELDNHITIDVTISNRLPIAKLTPDSYIIINGKNVEIIDGMISETVYEDDEITFHSNASLDVDGYISTYNWDFGDGVTHYEYWEFISGGNNIPIVETYYPPGYDINYTKPDITFDRMTSHRYFLSQEYTITLTVTDKDGGESNTSFNIRIENREPTATPGYTSINGRTVSFTAYFLSNNVPDSDSDIPTLNYSWDFGDGSTGHGINLTHKYKEDGKFGVVLTVTDDDGAYDKKTLIIEVGEEDDDLGLFIGAVLILIIVILVILFLIFKQGPEKRKNNKVKGWKKTGK